MAANIFDGSTDGNWGTAANWSLGAVPLIGDGNVATFDATSPNCTINSTARACNGLDMTGYLGTLSGTIAEGLVKAVPTITADFETPVFPENHIHVEVPGAAKGGQGGGNKEGGNKS